MVCDTNDSCDWLVDAKRISLIVAVGLDLSLGPASIDIQGTPRALGQASTTTQSRWGLRFLP